MDQEKLCKELLRLVQIVERLRGPEGCPWDRQQNYYSLKSNILEEAYEVVETLLDKNIVALKEELGDLLLQVIFQSQIGRENKDFDLIEVIGIIADKLIRRHPHVFGGVKVDSIRDVKNNWDEIKSEEKSEDKSSLLDDFCRSQPALNQAYELQKIAAEVGFDWDNIPEVWLKVEEELTELRQAIDNGDKIEIEDEFGDLLFALVNLSRFLDLNPEVALLGTISKFKKRFKYMEEIAARSGESMACLSLDEMERLWEKSKEMEE